ncbi:MAG: hydroxyacid dehydrogenase [Phycisphaerae bacterium]|nr:hydroxyacid dehydrogenase [Phycisphaerae bacterium]
MRRLRGLYILDEETFPLVYGPTEQQDIERHVEFIAPLQTRASIAQHPGLLNSVEVIFSGWSPPKFDDAFFELAPNLKAIFYAAGQISIADSAWKRGLIVTTAQLANSQPVAEYSLAMIILSLKQSWRLVRETREQRTFVDRNGVAGCYGATVGIISLGAIGRALIKLLAQLDVSVVLYDPFVTGAQADELGVELVTLDEVFTRADVVSLHAPLRPETVGLITGAHLRSMNPRATFLNTARGAIVRMDQLIEVATDRPDLQFILDVTDPDEPPHRESPLYDLPNVLLTPHIAGSSGGECRRMGRWMVEELERFVAGEPLRWSVVPPSGNAS